jgi:hypothetical protein
MSIKRISSFLLFALFVPSILISLNSCDTTDPTPMTNEPDYVLNGGFEQEFYYTSLPQAWDNYYDQTYSDFISMQLDDSVSHSGNRSASIQITENNPLETGYCFFAQFIDRLSTNTQYKLSGWIKMETFNEQAYILLRFNDSSNVFISISQVPASDPIIEEYGWKYYEIPFQLPENASTAAIYLYVSIPENKGNTIWFDDIKIDDLSE